MTPRNPDWRRVLKENAEAGFTGIELGPVGYMPEEPAVLAEALAEYNQELIGGVIFPCFSRSRTLGEMSWMARCAPAKPLRPMAPRGLVIIDSISPRRAPTAGRAA